MRLTALSQAQRRVFRSEMAAGIVERVGFGCLTMRFSGERAQRSEVRCNRGLYGWAERFDRETERVESSGCAWVGPTGESPAGGPGPAEGVIRGDGHRRLNRNREKHSV